MTIRIFIGTPANNEDLESQAVLDWSLHKHASEPLDIIWMKLSRDPASFWYSDPKTRAGWNTIGWATPFSAFRWAIPEFCGFEGRAIYLDVDMMAVADIAELWNAPMIPGAMAIAKGPKTFCCSLLDCAKAKQYLPPVARLRSEVGLYRHVRKSFTPTTVQTFDYLGNWNCLDGEDYKSLDDPRIKLIHCTTIPTQPQLKYALARLAAAGQRHWYDKEPVRPHRRADIPALFDDLLAEARANGYHPENYATAEVFGDYGR
jgi:hypothetical protein